MPSAHIAEDHLVFITWAQRNPAQPIKALRLAASSCSMKERTTRVAQQASALEKLRE